MSCSSSHGSFSDTGGTVGSQVLHFMKYWCFKTEVPIEEKTSHKVSPIPELRNLRTPSWWDPWLNVGLDFVGINSLQAGLAPARGSWALHSGGAAAGGGFFPQGTPARGTCSGWDTAQAPLQAWKESEGEKKSRKHVWPKITQITWCCSPDIF